MKESKLRELLMLPRREKMRLACDLLNSIADEEEELTPAQKKMLDERWAAYKANPQSAMTLDEFYKKIKFKPKRKRT